MTLHQEQADQAAALLGELGLDCWLTFVRETGERPDPGVDLLLGSSMTWTSALLFGRDGSRTAIVGRYDVENVRLSGVFPEVVGYDEDISAPLLDALRRLDPQRIGLNYSLDDHTADGLTYGMRQLLDQILAGTPYAGRLDSAGKLLASLRARKTPAEQARISAAIAVTEEIVGLVGAQIRPGVSAADLADFVHAEFSRRGLPSSWDWNY